MRCRCLQYTFYLYDFTTYVQELKSLRLSWFYLYLCSYLAEEHNIYIEIQL